MASKIDEQLAERDESDNESRKQFSESGGLQFRSGARGGIDGTIERMPSMSLYWGKIFFSELEPEGKI